MNEVCSFKYFFQARNIHDKIVKTATKYLFRISSWWVQDFWYLTESKICYYPLRLQPLLFCLIQNLYFVFFLRKLQRGPIKGRPRCDFESAWWRDLAKRKSWKPVSLKSIRDMVWQLLGRRGEWDACSLLILILFSLTSNIQLMKTIFFKTYLSSLFGQKISQIYLGI